MAKIDYEIYTGPGNSLAVQWLGLCTSTGGGTISIPGQGTCCVARPKGKKRNIHRSNEGNGEIW